ncbi:hypothetical protein H0X48_03210 [Candidatus Dependentiae bacterium]|nr:hypothetical protein [Candidatus Dependentiae bacterium]
MQKILYALMMLIPWTINGQFSQAEKNALETTNQKLQPTRDLIKKHYKMDYKGFYKYTALVEDFIIKECKDMRPFALSWFCSDLLIDAIRYGSLETVMLLVDKYHAEIEVNYSVAIALAEESGDKKLIDFLYSKMFHHQPFLKERLMHALENNNMERFKTIITLYRVHPYTQQPVSIKELGILHYNSITAVSAILFYCKPTKEELTQVADTIENCSSPCTQDMFIQTTLKSSLYKAIEKYSRNLLKKRAQVINLLKEKTEQYSLSVSIQNAIANYVVPNHLDSAALTAFEQHKNAIVKKRAQAVALLQSSTPELDHNICHYIALLTVPTKLIIG